MRNALIIGTVLLSAGCAMQPQPAPQVSWSYGAGNGDGVSYPGPKPVFQRAYGLGNGDGVTSGQTATTRYGYGADGMSGTMVQTTPEQRQQMAAPTPPPATAPTVQPAPTAPGTHI